MHLALRISSEYGLSEGCSDKKGENFELKRKKEKKLFFIPAEGVFDQKSREE